MNAATEHLVDARYLDPPEPFVRTMEALDRLGEGERLQLLIFREPHPLFRVLRQNGYAWATRLDDDGTFVVTIWKDAGAAVV